MKQLAVFGGGCFWGVEHVFRKHFPSLPSISVGYCGGKRDSQLAKLLYLQDDGFHFRKDLGIQDNNNDLLDIIPSNISQVNINKILKDNHMSFPNYNDVCNESHNGAKTFAEVIAIEYDTDDENVSFVKLLDLFFRSHDPTTLDQQGNDIGSQYRSVIFPTTKEQLDITKKYISKLQVEVYGNKPIKTSIEPFVWVFKAEEYHQNYLIKNPSGYHCATHFIRNWPSILPL